MKLDMKLGAEPKKIVLLGVLLVGAVYVLVFSPFSDSSTPSSSSTTAARRAKPSPEDSGASTPMVPGAAPTYEATRPAVQRAKNRGPVEFKPSLKPKRPEDRPDPTTYDPTLRTDILQRLQNIKLEGGHRNLFAFGAAPPPPTQIAKAGGLVPNPLMPNGKPFGPEPPPPPPAPVVPPPPPAIPLKFYGYINPASKAPRRAFFLEGDDIHVVGEGDMVKNRYKIVRIGVNSVVVEDNSFHNQQTLPLEDAPGSSAATGISPGAMSPAPMSPSGLPRNSAPIVNMGEVAGPIT